MNSRGNLPRACGRRAKPSNAILGRGTRFLVSMRGRGQDRVGARVGPKILAPRPGAEISRRVDAGNSWSRISQLVRLWIASSRGVQLRRKAHATAKPMTDYVISNAILKEFDAADLRRTKDDCRWGRNASDQHYGPVEGRRRRSRRGDVAAPTCGQEEAPGQRLLRCDGTVF